MDVRKAPMPLAAGEGSLRALRELVEQEPPDVDTAIHPDDGMHVEGDLDHYFRAGSSALRAVRLALLAARKDVVHSILDLPSGYGRVLRQLRAAFPAATLTACELMPDAVEFCAERFGALPVVSAERPEDVELEGPFDLVWCGSLVTHLDEERWRGFLSLFASVLAPGGVLVMTTHGRFVGERIRGGVEPCGPHPAGVDEVLEGYLRRGFGYAEYPGEPNYGISLSSPAWVWSAVDDIPSLRVVSYAERGWDDHQDVLACVRE
jgi:SAM-dependent methyltransferase